MFVRIVSLQLAPPPSQSFLRLCYCIVYSGNTEQKVAFTGSHLCQCMVGTHVLTIVQLMQLLME